MSRHARWARRQESGRASRPQASNGPTTVGAGVSVKDTRPCRAAGGVPERSTAVRVARSLRLWFLQRVRPLYVGGPLPASPSPILARQDGKVNTTAQTLDPAGHAG